MHKLTVPQNLAVYVGWANAVFYFLVPMKTPNSAGVKGLVIDGNVELSGH